MLILKRFLTTSALRFRSLVLFLAYISVNLLVPQTMTMVFI